MTTLNLSEDDIPDLHGIRVLITGASSGIGQAAGNLFAKKGAWVLNLDLNPPSQPPDSNYKIEYRHCDVTKWEDLVSAFEYGGEFDVAVSNAGVDESGSDYFEALQKDETTGRLIEPKYPSLDVNLRGTINFTRLAVTSFLGRPDTTGSIVITSSVVGYWPEQSLPVYSASKAGLIGLMRALRSSLDPEKNNITINAVAPAATITALVPREMVAPLFAAGIPVSTAEFVALAIVYSAVANQSSPVELYGKDIGLAKEGKLKHSRWNGRTILTLGDRYTEIEGPLAQLKPQWFGDKNFEQTNLQQTIWDHRYI